MYDNRIELQCWKDRFVDGKEIRRLLRSNLRRYRAKKGLSQLALALKVGMTHNFINDIENGKKWVSPDTLAKLAQALEIEPYQLLTPELSASEQEKNLLATYYDDLSNSVNEVLRSVSSRYLDS
jgi:transcriptional regulator with XRE-family HTH domain